MIIYTPREQVPGGIVFLDYYEGDKPPVLNHPFLIIRSATFAEYLAQTAQDFPDIDCSKWREGDKLFYEVETD